MTLFLWTKPQNALKSILGALFLILCTSVVARATHLAAADISVRYIGTQPGDTRCVPILTYEVTLEIYKACEYNGSSLGPSEGIHIATPSGCYTGVSLDFTMTNPTIDTIDQLCRDSKQFNACRMTDQGGEFPNVTGAQPGFIRHRYVDTVSLPYACGDWIFSWASGNRNKGVDNLLTPDATDIFVSCLINNVLSPKGSSPRFTITPTPFLCVNKPSSFLNGPETIDGGTIMIQPTVAKTDVGSPDTGAALPYKAPYTPANPVNSPSGYRVNPQTGSTEFIAPTQGKFVLAFRMFLYDSAGRMVSYVDRDVQVAVLPCVGNVPTVTDPPQAITGGKLVQSGDSGNVMTVCPGSTLRFNIAGFSGAPTALMSMTDTLGSKIGKLSFVATKNPAGFANNVLGTFEYTPTTNEAGRQYTKIFTVSDTSCGVSNQKIFQSSYVSVLIKVPGGIEAGVTGYYCPTDTANKTGYPINVYTPDTTTRYAWEVLPGGADINSLSCTDCQRPSAHPDSNTTYIVTALPTPYLCKNKDTLTVEVNRITITPREEMVICQPGLVQLQSTISGKKRFQDLRCGEVDSFANCPNPQTGTVGYCSDITLQQTPFRTTDGSVHTQLIYQAQELTDAGLTNSSIRSVSFYVDGTPSTTPLKEFKISMACTPRRTYSDGQGFVRNTAQVFSAATLPPLVTGWNTFPVNAYSWDPSQNLVVDICFNNGAPITGSTSSAVQYSATGASSVLQSASNITNTCLVSPPALGSVNRPNIRFDYCLPQSFPFLPYWTPGTYFVDSDVANPTLYVPKTLKVYAQVKGYQGCISRDSLTIILAQDTIVATPADSLICPGDIAILKASKADYYRWFEGRPGVRGTTIDCDSCPVAVIRPTNPTDYFLVGYNYWGKDSTVCSDTFQANIRFKTPNRVAVTPKEVTIKYGESVPLYAQNATVYNWSPATALNTTVGPSVIASPKATTTYIVTGLTEGCQSSDTSKVIVDRGTVVAVANAFTPNGDNVNDFFAPSTMPTQRVTEFRIFNRWGNQVFYSTSATPGWDGTYNSEPQDGGTYSYIIRVTTPDGAAETIKGDVLLIR